MLLRILCSLVIFLALILQTGQTPVSARQPKHHRVSKHRVFRAKLRYYFARVDHRGKTVVKHRKHHKVDPMVVICTNRPDLLPPESQATLALNVEGKTLLIRGRKMLDKPARIGGKPIIEVCFPKGYERSHPEVIRLICQAGYCKVYRLT